jgi:hypothetical protein
VRRRISGSTILFPRPPDLVGDPIGLRDFPMVLVFCSFRFVFFLVGYRIGDLPVPRPQVVGSGVFPPAVVAV